MGKDDWRGIGEIEQSGLKIKIREKYANFDWGLKG